jgi:glutathione S-transferase
LTRSFVLKSGNATLLGQSALEKALVSQWLTFCSTAKYSLSADALKTVDAALASRSFLAGGPAATVADAMAFFLSYNVACKEMKQARGLVHFSRWFDQMQQVNGVARTPFPTVSTPRSASVLVRTNR